MIPLLDIQDLHAFYEKSHVLHGVSLNIAEGEIVALLGRNGVGRSTLAKSIIGQVNAKGSIRFRGRQIVGLRTHQIAQLGVGYVPENRDIFAGMTVQENLLLGFKSGGRSRWKLDDIYAMLPILYERRNTMATVLSGGEQQMLTLCRTLLGDPLLIVVDEPTEGLAPMMIKVVADLLLRLKDEGLSILLIEQKLTIALAISERLYVMGRGTIVFDGTPAGLHKAPTIRQEWLEV